MAAAEAPAFPPPRARFEALLKIAFQSTAVAPAAATVVDDDNSDREGSFSILALRKEF